MQSSHHQRRQSGRSGLMLIGIVCAVVAWFILTQTDDGSFDAPPPLATAATSTPRPPAPVATLRTDAPAPTRASQPTVPPLRPGELIPRIIHLSWKTLDLPEAARGITDEWDATEPDYVRRITTDDECLALAAEWPRLYPLYKAQTMKVMRADICRYLIVYKYGGIYRDLDVKHVLPLKQWFNHSAPVVYGHEDEHLCQWFFAASKGNSCIRDVIEYVTDTLQKNITFANAPPGWDLVIDGTGPGAFTVGMRNCTTRPQHTPADMVREKVKHEFAAMNWKEGYSSWLVQRQKVLGWSDMFGGSGRDEFIRNYYFSPSAKILAPLDDKLPPLDVHVWQSHHRFGELLLYYAARFALDRNLDTFVQTENGEGSSWDMRFNSKVRYVKYGTDAPDAIQCVRVWNKRRLHDSEFYRGLRLFVFDENAVEVFRSGYFGSEDAYWLIKFNAIATTGLIGRIQIQREHGAVLFSEAEFFGHPDCLGPARRLTVHTTPTDAPPAAESRDLYSEGRRLSSAFRVMSVPCENNTAVSWDDRHQYTFCHSWPLPRPCKVLTVASGSEQPDAPMSKMFLNWSCQVESLVEATSNDPDEAPVRAPGAVVSVIKYSGNLAELVAKASATVPIALLHVQLHGPDENWKTVEDLVKLAERRAVMHVFIELCAVLPNNIVDHAPIVGWWTSQLRRLQQAYLSYAWHVTPRTPYQSMGVQVPACVQLSLVNPLLLPATSLSGKASPDGS